jgi:hypothetical protein
MTKRGIGYTFVAGDHYEVSDLNEGRIKIDGEYRHYATAEEAAEAAFIEAIRRRTKFVGEIK